MVLRSPREAARKRWQEELLSGASGIQYTAEWRQRRSTEKKRGLPSSSDALRHTSQSPNRFSNGAHGNRLADGARVLGHLFWP
ncbi:hypothetical protein DVH05_002190 [Phytophthora capsici]|nr:hypothetical protein DVH05_002190 [Phytophthora capsici]